MLRPRRAFVLPLLLFLIGSFLSVPFQSYADSEEPAANYLFRDSFYASPSLKLKYDVYETNGFLLVRDHHRGLNSEFSIVSGFHNPVLESRVLKNIRTIDESRAFIEKNMRKIFFERLPIRELPLVSQAGEPAPHYWVGQRAFDTLEKAKAAIIEAKTAIDAGGGDFDRALELVDEFFPEEPGPTAEQVEANFLAEEELALKMMDWLDVGEKLYGPFTGTPMGEPLLWQSFGETTFRWTNLDRAGFNDQVGFWSNRLVFKGFRLLGEQTIDPYVEATTALESQGENFPSHLDLIAGLEYRPFGRSAFLHNFNFAGLYILKFMRNYRFFVQYMERKNLTDEIADSRDSDLWAGADIFYEWGLDLDAPWVKPERHTIAGWIRDYVWGEYFGSYRFERSDFSSIDEFNSPVFNSSVIFGVKWPQIKLPRNPINDKLELMPYIRLEHTTNPRLELSFQNQFLVIGGIRWMPFRSYQFQDNEWLFLTKVFAEYVGIGGIRHPGPSKPRDVPDRDWRVGIKMSFNRY